MLRLLKKHKISPAVLLIEIVAIFLSLSLAFLINEWRQNARDEATANHALTSIRTELLTNKRFIEDRLPYYRQMRDTLTQILQTSGDDILISEVELKGYRGVMPPLIRKSSLETAQSIGAFTNIKYQVADHIGMVYAFQDFYRDIIDKYITALTNGNLKTVRSLLNFFSELIVVGEELTTAYGELLAKMAEIEGIGEGEALHVK